ncbi:hypothetical protein COOONC_11921, partial [Cooperia oncophora]
LLPYFCDESQVVLSGFTAVTRWVRFDQANRQKFLPKAVILQLLEHVRLALCHPKFLVETVSEDPLVMTDPTCRHLLDEAKNYQLLRLSTQERLEMQETRTKPRKSLKTSEELYLLEHVRLALCHPKFLVETVSEDPLVMTDPTCRHLLDEAKNYQLMRLSTQERLEMQETRTKPRKSLKTSEELYDQQLPELSHKQSKVQGTQSESRNSFEIGEKL